MTETRTAQNPKPMSVLEQFVKLDRQRRRQELAENIWHGLLLAIFVTALVVCAVTFACAAMC